MHVVVVIVAFKNATDVRRCLNALQKSTYLEFEVVICENGGDVAYREILTVVQDLRLKQHVRVIQAPTNGGFASGVNICLQAVPNANAWWLLNPDTEPHPNAMAAMIRKLSNGKYDAVGGVLCFSDGRVQSLGGLWVPWRGRFASIGFGSRMADLPQEVLIESRQNYLSGASMMIGRNFVERVGGMREDYFLYGEEVAWCIKAMRRDIRLGFSRDAKVTHYQGTTTGCTEQISGRSKLSVYLGERNRILLTRDYFPRYLALATLISFADLVVRFGRHRAWRQLGYAIAGWWAGIRNERGAV